MVELQCNCGASLARKIRSPRVSCDDCKRAIQNAGLRERRAARASIQERSAPQDPAASTYARTWYQSNKAAIKVARAQGLSVPEARRKLAAGRA